MTRFRFVSAGIRATCAFIAVSLRMVLEALRHGDDRNLTHRYASALSRAFIRIFGFRHQIRNGERLTAHQPCVYVSNHRSNLDVLTMCEIFPPATIIIAKKSVLKIPLLSTIFVRGRNIAIVREDKDDAQAGMSAAETAIRDEKLSVFIFPEGTRNFGRMKPFKKGAFHLARNVGAPIVPLICAVTPGWLDGRRMTLKRDPVIAIEVLEPIDPARFSDLDSLMAHTHSIMSERLEGLEQEVRERGRM